MDNAELDERPRTIKDVGLVIAMAGLAVTFLVQFGGSVWWGATLSADLRHVTETLARMETERYTKADAARDIQRLEQRNSAFAEQAGEIKARVSRLEERMETRSR